jgi:hypothetical protein
MALDTGKQVKIAFNNVLDHFEKQQQMAVLADTYNVSGAELQNAQNGIWRQVEQQTGVQDGWGFNDSDFGDIIEMSYLSQLGSPRNSLKALRADDFRDPQFMERWATTAAARLTADQNSRIANVVKDTGSLFYNAPVDGTTGKTGYDAVKMATTMLSERQAAQDMGTTVFLNDRDAQIVSSDIANRSNMNGLPETVYKNGMIAYNTAGSNLYESSYLPAITGSATPTTTVATTVSQKPVAQRTEAGGIILPVDYRISDAIAFTDASGFAVGDWISFTGINSLGLHDKTDTGQEMTFKIVDITGNNVKVYPKPIALDDASLTIAEKAYANIATQITSGDVPVRLNTANKRTNMFWTNDSIEIINGDAPLEYLGELDGMKVMSETLSSGTKVYMAYQGSINDFTLKCRLFTWYGVTNRDPSRNGVFTIS